MLKGILFAAIALASLLTAPAFLTYPVAAQNQTSADDGTTTDGGTGTTDGTTTDGGTNATAPESTTFNKVTAKFKGSNYKWECVPKSGKSFKVAVEDGTVVKASRSSGPGLEETKNWGGSLRLEGVTHNGKNFVKEVKPSSADMTGKAGSKSGFSITGTITEDNLCHAPHVGDALAGNLTSTELDELSAVGKSMKIEGPCNTSSGTVTVTAGGKPKTFGHTDVECYN
jgi:hypothetical protein